MASFVMVVEFTIVMTTIVMMMMITGTDAFVPVARKHPHHQHRRSSFGSSIATNTAKSATIFSGEVTNEATKQLDHYHVMAQSIVYTPGSGKPVVMKDLWPSSSSSSPTNTNIVVFLRSLG